MRLPLFLISLIILSNATLLPAQVYKWVDNEGKTHYGDKPQSNAAETVHIKKTLHLTRIINFVRKKNSSTKCAR
jgi:hypothetical protein